MLKEILLIFVLFSITLSDGVLINPTSNPSSMLYILQYLKIIKLKITFFVGLQMIFGLGVPLNLENESVTYGKIKRV